MRHFLFGFVHFYYLKRFVLLNVGAEVQKIIKHLRSDGFTGWAHYGCSSTAAVQNVHFVLIYLHHTYMNHIF